MRQFYDTYKFNFVHSHYTFTFQINPHPMTKKQHGSLMFALNIQTAILIAILSELLFK